MGRLTMIEGELIELVSFAENHMNKPLKAMTEADNLNRQTMFGKEIRAQNALRKKLEKRKAEQAKTSAKK